MPSEPVRAVLTSARGRRGGLTRVTAAALAVAALALSTAGMRGFAATLTLDVVFTANGTISMTLPDGTPVGSSSGAPTVIPGGFYTVMFSGPAGTSGVPTFQLSGPGVDLTENMDEGGAVSASAGADFLPASTYTWTNSATPGAVYTFTTSASVVGTAPTTTTPGGATAPSQDIVGSALPSAGRTLSATVSAAGHLTLREGATPVTRLAAGRYTITVADRSATKGFLLQKGRSPPLVLTGAAFVGTRSTSLDLSAGRWDFAPGLRGTRTYFAVAS